MSRTVAYHPLDPSTPIHSPHGSVASTARSRTPGQLSLHEYRKQQATGHNVGETPDPLPKGQKVIRRKVAVLSLHDDGTGKGKARTGPPTAPPTPLWDLIGAVSREDFGQRRSGDGHVADEQERARGPRTASIQHDEAEAELAMRQFFESRNRRRAEHSHSQSRQSEGTRSLMSQTSTLSTANRASRSAVDIMSAAQRSSLPTLAPDHPHTISSYSAVAYPALVDVNFDPSPPPSPSSPLLSPGPSLRRPSLPKSHSPLSGGVLRTSTPLVSTPGIRSSSSPWDAPSILGDSEDGEVGFFQPAHPLHLSPTALPKQKHLKPSKKLPKPSALSSHSRYSKPAKSLKHPVATNVHINAPRTSTPAFSDFLFPSSREVRFATLSEHTSLPSIKSLPEGRTGSKKQSSFSSLHSERLPSRRSKRSSAAYTPLHPLLGKEFEPEIPDLARSEGENLDSLTSSDPSASFSDLFHLYGSSEALAKDSSLALHHAQSTHTPRHPPWSRLNVPKMADEQSNNPYHKKFMSKESNVSGAAGERRSFYPDEFDSKSILNQHASDAHGRKVGITDYKDCVDDTSGLNQIYEAYNRSSSENIPLAHRSPGKPPVGPLPPLPNLPVQHFPVDNLSSLEQTTNYGDTAQLLQQSSLPLEVPRALEDPLKSYDSVLDSELYNPTEYERQSRSDMPQFGADEGDWSDGEYEEEDWAEEGYNEDGTGIPELASLVRNSGDEWVTTAGNSVADMQESMTDTFVWREPIHVPPLQTNVQRRQMTAESIREFDAPSPHSTVPESTPSLRSTETPVESTPINYSRLHPSYGQNQSSLPIPSSVYSQDARQTSGAPVIGEAISVSQKRSFDPMPALITPDGMVDPAFLSSEPAADGDADVVIDPNYRGSVNTQMTQWENMYEVPQVLPLNPTGNVIPPHPAFANEDYDRRSLELHRMSNHRRHGVNERITEIDKQSGRRHSRVLGQNRLMDLEMGKLSPSGVAIDESQDSSEQPSKFSIFRRGSRPVELSPLDQARKEQREMARAYHLAYPREQREVHIVSRGRPYGVTPKPSSTLTRQTTNRPSISESEHPLFETQPHRAVTRPHTAHSSNSSDAVQAPLPLFHRPTAGPSTAVPRPLQLASLYPEFQQPRYYAQDNSEHRRNTSSSFTPPTIKLNRFFTSPRSNNNADLWGMTTRDPAVKSLHKWSMIYLALCIIPFMGLLCYCGCFDPLIAWHVRKATKREVDGMSNKWKSVAMHLCWGEVCAFLVAFVLFAVLRGEH